MKKTLRLLSLLVAAIMLFSLTACAGQNAAWAVEVDGEQIPIGVYLYYQLSAYQDAATLATDTETDVLKQTIEDQDATLWIYQKTLDYCKQKVAIEREFDRLGLALTEEDQTYIDSATQYMQSYYSEVYSQNGIGEESVKAAMTVSQKSQLIFSKYYGAGGLEEVPETELKDYFLNNYAVIYFFGTSLSGYDDETAEKARTAANTALESLKAGKSVKETAYAMNKAINPDTEMTEESTDDAFKQVVGKSDAGYPQSFRDKVFAASVDAPFLYDEDDYLSLVVRKDASKDTEAYDSLKDTVLSSIKGDEFNEKLKELGKDLAIVDNKDAVKFYSPKKIKLPTT